MRQDGTRLGLELRAKGRGIHWGKLATTGGLYIYEPNAMGEQRKLEQGRVAMRE